VIGLQFQLFAIAWLYMMTERKNISPSKAGVPLYTQGSFDKQLNYNLWSTSRIRYGAARRFYSKDRRSSKAVTFISAYMIVYTLADHLFLSQSPHYDSSYILIMNIMFSLLILIFSQLESSASYGVRALKFHECGQEVGQLYKRLRQLKSKYENRDKDEYFYSELKNIDSQYDLVMKNHENHEDIDFELFKSKYPKYEDHNLSWAEVKVICLKSYFKDVFFYHLVTYAPLSLFVYFVLNTLYTFQN